MTDETKDDAKQIAAGIVGGVFFGIALVALFVLLT